MNEITGPILAITLVLSSVLIPAFLGGITGQFFRQFAATISVAMLISAVNAMTMTPARAAWIFARRKPGEHGHRGKEALPWWSFSMLGGLAAMWPNAGGWLGLPAGIKAARSCRRATSRFDGMGIYAILFLPGAVAEGRLGWFLIRPVNWVLGLIFRALTGALNGRPTPTAGPSAAVSASRCRRAPDLLRPYRTDRLRLHRVSGGFVPSQDKGYLVLNIQLPDSASLERTVEVAAVVDRIARETPGVAHTGSHAGNQSS